MVHLRLNETEPNPNPHINFITPLKSDPTDQEEARKLLRALAAQVRPTMKAHGFVVNSFEEYEYNRVFAGRNWNNGETVELVLRRPDGGFYPIYWLMGTLCHELAHIKHMNHGPAFQALWSRLRVEVRQLQDRGYYGDGYWSSGTRLRDSARVGGEGVEEGDFPEYMCGGAQSRTRPTSRRRRAQGKRREVIPSLHTGAQTAKKRKAGARVTSKYAFTGEGATLAEDSSSGTGFGKKAASKRAREERALAAERRLLALQGKPVGDEPSVKAQPASSEENSDDEVEFVTVPETDAERREALLASEQTTDLDEKLRFGNSWKQFRDDFNFTATPSVATSGSTFTTQSHGSSHGQAESSSDARAKCKGKSKATLASSSTPRAAQNGGLGLGKMVQTEIDLRKKESIGMAPIKGGGRTLGSAEPAPKITPLRNDTPQSKTRSLLEHDTGKQWSCPVCTLKNEPLHLACAACATPRASDT
ncbi:WLM-domain-containing protein [Pholiota conissans]|uniref:WLM-domain-containing protein n=1 Tax=Pholiota conissans TaxID=109636 RepID=A0A9P5YT81_9AGAR|nr:WLM-domain-containing protein [Pholiota conissans]